MAEQFAFEQPGRNGGAVELDEGALAALTEAVNGARQQFLAGSRFSLDEHCGIGGRDRLNLHEHLPQPHAFAYDVVISVFQIDLGFEILLLLVQLVAKLGDAAECHCIVDGHRHLNRNL